MSSILKALKRLEEEKAERLDTPVDIARDILRQPRRRSRTVPWLSISIAGCVVVVAIGVLIQWYARQSFTIAQSEKHAAGVSEVPQPSLPPASASVIETPEPAVENRPESGVVEERMVPFPVVVAGNPVAVHNTAGTSTAVAAPDDSMVPVARTDMAPKAAPVSTNVRSEAMGPHLVVSEIFIQPGPEARLAIVNDLPVMERTHIEGAEVVEILSDRVRFSREGSVFEVKLETPIEP